MCPVAGRLLDVERLNMSRVVRQRGRVEEASTRMDAAGASPALAALDSDFAGTSEMGEQRRSFGRIHVDGVRLDNEPGSADCTA